jgi:hypothetical protein
VAGQLRSACGAGSLPIDGVDGVVVVSAGGVVVVAPGVVGVALVVLDGADVSVLGAVVLGGLVGAAGSLVACAYAKPMPATSATAVRLLERVLMRDIANLQLSAPGGTGW